MRRDVLLRLAVSANLSFLQEPCFHRHMNIIFDFDHTLFDTSRFLTALSENFATRGISKSTFYKALTIAYDAKHMFQPSHFLYALAESKNSSYKLFEKQLISFCGSLNTYVYPDVISFLQTIQQSNHTFLLLTFGDEQFQRMKIEGAGLVPYFERVIVTDNVAKDEEVEKLSSGKQTMFIDDNPVALMAVKRHAPHIVTVRTRRSDGEYVNVSIKKGIDYEIQNLNELQKLIS